MPTLTVTKNYEDGQVLTQAHLDDAFQSIETFTNTTKLDSTNLQSGAVVEATLASNAVTAAKIAADAVTTTKIADSNVTTAKIADSNVTTAKIADSNVTTGKIADAAVTQSKRAALGQQISSSSGTFQTTSTTFTDVTNLSVSITTTGRPVLIALVSDGSGSEAFLAAGRSSGASQVFSQYRYMRDSTEISQYYVQHNPGTNSTFNMSGGGPYNLLHIDTPSAGTYTYKLQCKATISSTDAYCWRMKLVAFEL